MAERGASHLLGPQPQVVESARLDALCALAVMHPCRGPAMDRRHAGARDPYQDAGTRRPRLQISSETGWRPPRHGSSRPRSTTVACRTGPRQGGSAASPRPRVPRTRATSLGIALNSHPGVRIAIATGNETARAPKTTTSPTYTQAASAPVQISPEAK